MSLKNALIGYKKQLEDKNIDDKIFKMLEEQKLSMSEDVKPKKEKKFFNEDVIDNGGNTQYNLDGKWWNISVHTCEEYPDGKKYKYHVNTAMGYRMFISAKTYLEAQKVVNEILGKNYKVSGSKV